MRYLLLTLTLLTACSEPEVQQTRSGILDWSAYTPWVSEAPQLIQVAQLDDSTRRLLNENVRLAEIILSTPAPATPPNHREALQRLKAREPRPASASYTDRDTRRTNRQPITTQQSLIETYSRRWSGITLSNLDSVVTQLARQVERDTALYQRNSGTTTAGGAQSTANLRYVQQWSNVILEARRLLLEVNRPAPTTDREKALAEWRQFQKASQPILRTVVAQKEIARHTIAPDGTYEITGEGDLILHFKAGPTELYYPLNAPHRFRTFAGKK